MVKVGRHFACGAVVEEGDKNGQVGEGYGKASEVLEAIRKGMEEAKRIL